MTLSSRSISMTSSRASGLPIARTQFEEALSRPVEQHAEQVEAVRLGTRRCRRAEAIRAGRWQRAKACSSLPTNNMSRWIGVR